MIPNSSSVLTKDRICGADRENIQGNMDDAVNAGTHTLPALENMRRPMKANLNALAKFQTPVNNRIPVPRTHHACVHSVHADSLDTCPNIR